MIYIDNPEKESVIQRIEEKDGYLFLYFDNPPEHLGKIEFVNCIAYQNKEILFCKWQEDNLWVLPGGRIETDETVEDALNRELLEETGAILKNSEVLCYIHCFMYKREYWGIAYLGEIKQLGVPTDLNEVSEAKLFSSYPDNRSQQGPFENQSKALYGAAMHKLSLLTVTKS